MLSLTRVTCRRGGRVLVDEASLDIRPGHLVAILGCNGAGKSTLLGLATGAIRPDGGRVALDNVSLERIPAERLARRRAVMSQADMLGFGFTAAEVVALGRSPFRGVATPDEDHAAIRAAMTETGIEPLAGRIVTRLSGGERRRVQLARTLAQAAGCAAEPGTRALLLDEPNAALDIARQRDLARVMRRAAEGGLAVAAVLHDPDLAAAVADEVVLMRAGRILDRGAPAQVLTPAAIDAVYDVTAEVMIDATTGRPKIGFAWL
ncbi:hemin import ATP-binding protein HmuV [Tistrella bauzanensis]|uniref:Hemin import ATP-binding protein HmuV n=1 Tax=Tistrella bauzanensis TaxID=657419 RepID=A0ABQ1ILH7_9PROT|nr:heme ABC transporter ATP-binding protein [Tistrella bauzanensis]GGB43662.1 hemin import ATP-binding protein HmuV [Tistrella bauzanensis]